MDVFHFTSNSVQDQAFSFLFYGHSIPGSLEQRGQDGHLAIKLKKPDHNGIHAWVHEEYTLYFKIHMFIWINHNETNQLNPKVDMQN